MSGRVLVDDEEAGDPLIYASNRRVAEVAPLRRALRRRRRRSCCAIRAGSARSSSIPTKSRLGPDALDAHAARSSTTRSAPRTAPVKAVLMDQARIAGLGNLLVDEALWRAGIDPARPAAALDADERTALHRAIRTTLRMLGRRGGSHTGDHAARDPDAPVPTRRRAAPAAHRRRPHHLLVPVHQR